MKVLIVDDDPNKMQKITAFVAETFSGVEVQGRRSYQSGVKAVLTAPPDIVILDMTMPTRDVGGKEKGGKERRYAGVQALRQLKRKGVKTHVVVVTQFERFGEGDEQITLDELRDELSAEFRANYVCTIFYQVENSRWMDDLRDVLSRLLGAQGGGS